MFPPLSLLRRYRQLAAEEVELREVGKTVAVAPEIRHPKVLGTSSQLRRIGAETRQMLLEPTPFQLNQDALTVLMRPTPATLAKILNLPIEAGVLRELKTQQLVKRISRDLPAMASPFRGTNLDRTRMPITAGIRA